MRYGNNIITVCAQWKINKKILDLIMQIYTF